MLSGNPYALAFVDVRMPPGWDGIETIRNLWQADPYLQVVLCTAHSDYTWNQIRDHLGQSERLLILKKPFDNLEVRQLANALTEKWNLALLARTRTSDLEWMVADRTRELQKTLESLRESQERQVRQERLAAVGQLAGGVAHEFNNIMTVVRGYVSLLLGEPHLPEDAALFLNEINKGADRAVNLTRQLLTFCRRQVMQPRTLDLNGVVLDLVRLLQRILGGRIVFRTNLAPQLPRVHADQAMIEQLITNLVFNARDAMPEGGQIQINTRYVCLDRLPALAPSEARPGPFIHLEVMDEGCGMDPATKARLFEPFFTTKEVGKGCGLGLAAVYGIVQQHNGWIEVESQIDIGSNFRIILPASGIPMANPNTASPVLKTANLPAVLAVVDDQAVLSMIQKLLEVKGFHVATASTPSEITRARSVLMTPLSILILDLDRVGMVSSPQALVNELKKDFPSMAVIYTSSGDPKERGIEPRAELLEAFLAKPLEPNSLIAKLQSLAEQHLTVI
jgi:signal transduction histidine kinase